MPIRIFLVDDHLIVRDGLRLRLEQEPGFTVVGGAATAAEAQEAISRIGAEVVVMDLNLPGENGFVATTKIRTAYPETRVIVLTAQFGPTTVQDALLAGASGFVRKDDASDELIRAVRTVVLGKTYLSPDAATAVSVGLLARPEPPRSSPLTEQEIAVLKGLARGLSYKEIANELNISPKSVETYRARMVKKLGCATRAELVRYAIREGFIEP